MEPTVDCLHDEEPETLEKTLRQMFCPACGGYLMRSEGFSRCLRCHLSMCESCEGGVGDEG
jgi:hypothetical protein